MREIVPERVIVPPRGPVAVPEDVQVPPAQLVEPLDVRVLPAGPVTVRLWEQVPPEQLAELSTERLLPFGPVEVALRVKAFASTPATARIRAVAAVKESTVFIGISLGFREAPRNDTQCGACPLRQFQRAETVFSVCFRPRNSL